MPETLSPPARWLAAIIAAVAWLGLAVQFEASFLRVGSVVGTAWAMLRFFTIIANLCSAILFTGIAWRPASFARPFAIAGATAIMLLVGITYAMLLRGLVELSGGAKLADFLLHTATPILVPLFWLLFVPKGRLRWRDPSLWAILPLLYLPYALVRGTAEGHYVYPFIDLARIGGMRVALNALGLLAAFLSVGLAMVAIDRRLER
ncbi:MAG: Pr6Pr family membrane protein [Sphingomonas sp.]|nr:Pr6Pr family membrane protein [Sphingomonas sp.]